MVLFVAAVLSSAPLSAAPWIEVGDERIRHHLKTLNDAGVISIQLNTWPLMWADVHSAIADVDLAGLSSVQRLVIRELQFEKRHQTKQTLKRSLELNASNSRSLFRGFGSSALEKGEIHHSFDWDGESAAFKLKANIVSNPGKDLSETHFDGSYLAWVLGDWVFGAGAIDRWWGPGQQSSLILSNNARPIPALMFRSKGVQSFASPWLSWLGRWQFVSFVGQLESSRVIPEAKLTGMRFSFSPVSSLELGLSRAMQWGGKGRDQDISAFFKSLTSKDENTGDGAGNQIGGFDARYAFHAFGLLPSAVYAQAIGEDEAGYMPSKYTAQFGFDTSFELPELAATFRGTLEFTDSTAGALGSEHANTAYEHSVYKSGYRFRSRAIGAAYDNDARVVSVSGALYLPGQRSLSLVLQRLELNYDDSGGNSVASAAQTLWGGQLGWQSLLFDGRLSLGATLWDDKPKVNIDGIERFSVSAAWEYRY